MKTPHWFNRNRFFSIVRIAGAGVLVIAAAATAFIAARPSSAVAQSSPTNNRQPVTHQHFNGVEVPLTQSDEGVVSAGNFRNPPSPICSTTTSSATNVNTDCEVIRHNETTIAINPTNPLNQIGSANDQQILLTSGGTSYITRYARAHVTFDGGMTWTTYPINYNGYPRRLIPRSRSMPMAPLIWRPWACWIPKIRVALVAAQLPTL